MLMRGRALVGFSAKMQESVVIYALRWLSKRLRDYPGISHASVKLELMKSIFFWMVVIA